MQRLMDIRLHALWLVALALVLRLFLRASGPLGWGWVAPAAPALDLMAYLSLLAFLLQNRSLRGWGLLAAGLLSNLLAMAANGMKMPVSVTAMERVGINMATITAGQEMGHQILTAGARLPWLGDTIPLVKPLPFNVVVSVGDILVMVGLFVVIQNGMRRQRRAGHYGTARRHIM